MERFKTLKLVVYLLTIIVVFEVIMLVWMLFPGSLQIWVTLGTLLITLLYLAIMSLGLIKELKKIKEKEEK